VALLDKATFPRDKACGDLVGPRGLQLLADLGITVPSSLDVGDMVVVGPTGRRVMLPSFEGRTYPDHATAITRTAFDAALREAAINAGAVPFEGRAHEPLGEDGGLVGFRTDRGDALRADFVIGADGATSQVADASGLVDGTRVLWGFAVRTYLDQPVDRPVIVIWERSRWRAFPGYGWIFPGPDGGANVGIGIGTRADRRAGAGAVRALPDFLEHLHRLGLVDAVHRRPVGRHLGGWLKMGMVGTSPARGRVLLVGDAAGLVNPLQGEGIAHAMGSGRAAAAAVLGGADRASERYRRALASAHLPYQRITAAAHAALVDRPRAVAALGRLLTAPGVGKAVAGGWTIFWNELLEGAPPGSARAIASASSLLGNMGTSRTAISRWFVTNLPEESQRREAGG
jgi:geranylgeranyl reductase family protein